MLIVVSNLGRLAVGLCLTLFAATTAAAQMVYIVPGADRQSFSVVFSETLEPDTRVDIAKLTGASYYPKVAKAQKALAMTAGKHSWLGKAPQGTNVVLGQATYGLSGNAEKPALLVYHPKAMFTKSVTETAPATHSVLEITAEKVGHDTRFRLWYKGKPVANAKGTLKPPRKDAIELKTDGTGFTSFYHFHGRCLVNMQFTEAASGQHDGADYAEVKHFATLVLDL
jgi:hypothetical protein